MRSRLPGLRSPSGRLSRASLVKPVEPTVAMRARQAVAAGLADPEWGTIAGQLFLQGRLSASQYQAAKTYGALVRAYRRAIDAPTQKSGWTLASSTPGASGGIPDLTVYELSGLSAELEHLRVNLTGTLAALDRLVVDDQHDSPSIPEALAALTYLVSRWGVRVSD